MSTAGQEYTSIWTDLRGVSFQQAWLNAGGIRTRYLTSGSPDKPLLLFLHGTGGHAEAYSRNLGAHGEHFWTVCIDLIGHGWTDKPSLAYEIPDYAAHVLAVLKALGRKTAHVSGESLGGWVATYLAIHHPDKVNRIVLNTAGGWTAHPEVMSRLKKLSTEATTTPTWELIKSRLEFLMFDKSNVGSDLIATRLAIYAQPDMAPAMQRILCLQEMDVRRRNMFSVDDYASIKAPTLVVWTSHDPTATPEEGQQIARMIPNARYTVLNECGHWPQYENAPEFNHIHIEFLLGN